MSSVLNFFVRSVIYLFLCVFHFPLFVGLDVAPFLGFAKSLDALSMMWKLGLYSPRCIL